MTSTTALRWTFAMLLVVAPRGPLRLIGRGTATSMTCLG